MNTFFTSDLHYGHTNIIKFCNRPYSSVEEMDEALIQNYNSVVQNDDKVWFLGDLFFCDSVRAREILFRLNGRKHLILGNHDKMIRNQKPVQDMFEKIYPDLHQEHIDGTLVVMCHYPLLSWNKAFHGSYMLHGHCHNSIPFDNQFRRLDVGVDAHNYFPISWEDIKRKMKKVEPADARGR
jgi:calcineurin-like phosphoesterase family protein